MHFGSHFIGTYFIAPADESLAREIKAPTVPGRVIDEPHPGYYLIEVFLNDRVVKSLAQIDRIVDGSWIFFDNMDELDRYRERFGA